MDTEPLDELSRDIADEDHHVGAVCSISFETDEAQEGVRYRVL